MKKNYALKAFLISLGLGALIILPACFLGKGVLTLAGDLNIQQIPFLMMINNSVKSGAVLWTWFNDMGSNFIGTFSFYNLFSPFNILSYLFPANWIPYLIGPMMVLKYGVTGLTSYLFLKRYVKDPKWAILGSVLYSFSGFQLANEMFYHFHDVVAFFPLMLYTLDELVYENKRGHFAITVALCAMTNWFFFIGEVVFVVIYYIVKCLCKEYKFKVDSFAYILIEGFLGVAAASFVLVPTFLFTVGNPRIATPWTLKEMFTFHPDYYLGILKVFILPAEALSRKAIIFPNEFSSIELYLPFVGSILSFAALKKHYKKWDGILLFISILFMFIPILNSIFVLGQNTYYARWFFMPSLIMSLLAIECIEKKYSLKTGIIITSILYIVFAIYSYLFSRQSTYIYSLKYFIVVVVTAVVCLALVLIINRIKKEKKKFIFYMVLTSLFIIGWGNYIVYKYKYDTFEQYPEFKDYLFSEKDLHKYNDGRSSAYLACNENLGFTSRINNMNTFISNINASEFEFLNSLGIERKVFTYIDILDDDLVDVLGIKYLIECFDNENYNYNYEYLERSGTYDVFINKDYKKFGFNVKNYISFEDYLYLDYEERKSALLDTVVLDDEQIEKYKDLFDGKKIKYEVIDYAFVNNGFISHIKSSKPTLAVYAIPYDTGWEATVNGKKVDVEKVDHGLIAVKVEEGNNEVIFRYQTPGLKIGLIVSGLAILFYLGYVVSYKKKESSNK